MINLSDTDRKILAQVARKEIPADICLKNADVINCISRKIENCDVAISKGYIAAIGKGFDSRKTIDCSGMYLCPSFIDAHIHIESTFLIPREFARAVVPRGTGAVICDPHEIANCLGIKGIDYMIKASKNLPMAFYFTAPSCVPATHLETSGAFLGAEEIELLLKKEGVIGLGEMMNFPGVIYGDDLVHDKLAVARKMGVPIDGHAPGLSGDELCAYISAGIDSDHECTTAIEAKEKLDRGMYLFLRQGTSEKNLKDLLPVVDENTLAFCSLVSDDRHPDDLMDLGHMDYSLRIAVDAGLDPISAISMATLNPARRFGLKRTGAVAPGFFADLVLLDDLKEFNVNTTIFRGDIVARNNKLCVDLHEIKSDENVYKAIHVNGKLDFKIKAEGKKARIIGIRPGQIITDELILPVKIDGDQATSDTQRDILKLSVIERHHGSGNMATAFVHGLGIEDGAIASTVAHDSHNIIVAGADDKAMEVAVNALIDAGGGICVSKDSGVLALLPLPVAGLMSDEPIFKVRNKMDRVLVAVKELGSKIDNPFMILSFLALPVIPKLKLTDKGLVDVEKFDFVSLFV